MQKYQSENITDLAKALLNVQRTVQPVTKDAENPFTKSWYASLNSVMDACRDALIENGIWLCQYLVPVEQPNSIGLVTKLTHAESGQWQSSLAVVPLPKADPQGMGSAITYARRYALTAMLGMVTEDDDGEGAKNGKKPPVRLKLPVIPPESQKARQRDPSTATGHSAPSNRPPAARRRHLPASYRSGRTPLHHCHRQHASKKRITDRLGLPLEPTEKIVVEVCRCRIAKIKIPSERAA